MILRKEPYDVGRLAGSKMLCFLVEFQAIMSENSVPSNPLVNPHYSFFQWL